MLIKNSLILNEEFINSFSDLMTLKMPAKQCLEVSSCIDDILAQHQIVVRARRSIVDKYCSKDEDGMPIADEAGNLIFETPDLQKKCMAEIKEVLDEEIDLALSEKIKIPWNELMTPIQMKLLKDIIEIIEK